MTRRISDGERQAIVAAAVTIAMLALCLGNAGCQAMDGLRRDIHQLTAPPMEQEKRDDVPPSL